MEHYKFYIYTHYKLFCYTIFPADHWDIANICQKFTPYPAELIYLNIQTFEFVSRCRDPQHQVVENCSFLIIMG